MALPFAGPVRASALLIAASILAASCSGTSGTSPTAPSASSEPTPATTASTATSPTPSPSLIPSPSPTPDPVALLLATLTSPSLSGKADITVTEHTPSGILIDGQPGPSMPDTVTEVAGEAYFRGDDYVFRLQMKDSWNVWFGEVRADGVVMRRDFSSHPTWQQLTAEEDPDHPRLFAILRSLTGLEPAGTATLDGEQLLRFRAPATTELDLVAILYQSDAMFEKDTGTLEILARPDGTPVQVLITLTSDDFSTGYEQVMPSGTDIPDRTYEFKATLANIGTLAPIPDAAEALKPYTSKRWGPTLQVPADWTHDTSEPEFDQLDSQDPAYPAAMRIIRNTVSAEEAKDQAALLDSYARWAINDLQDAWGATLASGEEIEIDARKAYLFVMTAPAGSADAYVHLEAAVVKGRNIYTFAWHTAQGTELVDLYRFERILETVKLP